MKSCCRAEDAKLQTAQQLVNLLVFISVVCWGIFWIAMLIRERPFLTPDTILTLTEIETLELDLVNYKDGGQPLTFVIG